MNPDAILAEAVARVEYKLDLLFRALGLGEGVFPQMHFIGQVCPACKKMTEYQVDVANGVVARKCGCSTGKQPPLVPLSLPAPMQGAANATTADDGRDAGRGVEESAPADRSRR